MEEADRASAERWMDRALQLARQGEAQASPNPLVGAILVQNGQVVGEGFHTYAGQRHAEIIALEAAGPSARGATLYLNLEPCCHMGRTGPCTDAIIKACVRRVVVAMIDPNPAVAGRGLEQFRAAGVEVKVGVREEQAQRLNEAFAKWIKSRLPLVTLKVALTLDGQITLPKRRGHKARHVEERWVSSDESRAEVQRMRHAADAVLTGIGTVLADDPLLTDRTGLPRRRKLWRVVIDSQLRLPLKSKLVKSADGDVVVFTKQSGHSPRARALLKAGVFLVRIPGRSRRPDLHGVLKELGSWDVQSVLIEAGAILNWAALKAGIVDKMFLFYAPKILGGNRLPMALGPSRVLPGPPVLQNLTLHRFGPDFAVEGYLRDVYRNC